MNQQIITSSTGSIHPLPRSNVAESYIIELNQILDSDDEAKLRLVSRESVDQYFKNIRLVFKEFLQEMPTNHDDDKQRALILDMCELNALYSVKLKLNYELPADIAEIAYDFDNPDYPGLACIIDKIENKKYLIQTDKL